MTNPHSLRSRHLTALLLFLAGLAIWIPSSDVVELIVENSEVLLGRYSRSRFGALFLGTTLLWIAAGMTWALRRKPLGELLLGLVMVYLSTGASAFVLVIGSSFLSKPRYIEEKVSVTDPTTGLALSGIVRHRPPNERYELIQRDVPEQLRSYPDAPPGYPEFPLVLTTDEKGFRNPQPRERHDIVAVGDSFVAGSHVSDEQAWTSLLQQATGQAIYNLGVSGSDLLVYLNNFIALGRQHQPSTVLLMIYEGNDFREVPALPVARDTAAAASDEQRVSQDDAPAEKARELDIAALAKSSPVTKGLKRLSDEVLSAVGRDWPVPGYREAMGWMPLAISGPAGTRHYSFEPKRLAYLNNDPASFAASEDWQNVTAILGAFARLAQQDGFRLVVVYAPSAPHVVLPLAADRIPADQLQRFVRYKDKQASGDPETFKSQLLARLDTQENAVRAWCTDHGIAFISTTAALREAASAGQQVYFTYDQHWTPEGNAIVARLLQHHLPALH